MIGLSGRSSRSFVHLVLAGITVAVLLGFAVVHIDVGTMGLSRALLLPLGMLLLAPFFIALFRRQPINLLEPIFIVVFGYGLFLFVRPLYILTFNDFEFINYLGSSREAVPLTLLFSIVALATVYVGYYSSVGPSLASRLPTGSPEIAPRRLRNWGFFVLALGILLYGAFLGGPAAGSLASEALTSSAYFYLGIDIVAVGIALLFYWTIFNSRWRRILLIVFLVTTFFVAATYLGDRYRAVYLALTLIAGFYLFRGKSFSFRDLFFFLPPSLLYVAGVGSLRGGEREITLGRVTEFEAVSSLQRFFSSSGDLNIFDTFTKVVSTVPDSFSFVLPGRTFLYLFVAFVPRSLWPGKPEPTETLVNQGVMGDVGAVAEGTGFSYSLPGSFYIEGGLVMILIGMFIFGVFCRTIWSYYTLNGTLLSRAVLAVSLPYILLLQRGGFTNNDAIWYLTYLIPIIVGFYYAGRSGNRKPT